MKLNKLNNCKIFSPDKKQNEGEATNSGVDTEIFD